MAKYNAQDRRDLAQKGHALPDGSFPIADEEDFHSAVRNWNFGKQPNVAKQFIIKRARALGIYDKLPEKWRENIEHSDNERDYQMTELVDEFLAHHGVKGMRWGHHEASTSGGGAPLTRAQKRVANANAKVAKVKQQQKDAADHDSAVNKARSKIDAHDNKLAVAKAQYRVDKQTKGKAAAKASLNKVKSERASNLKIANLETTKERTDRMARELDTALNDWAKSFESNPGARNHFN